MGRLTETDNKYPIPKSKDGRWHPDHPLWKANHTLTKKARSYTPAELQNRIPSPLLTILHEQVARLNEANKNYFRREPDLVFSYKPPRRKKRR